MKARSSPTARSNAHAIRILLVIDHVMVRAGFRMLIETGEDCTVVGEADNYKAALSLVEREAPQIILFDPHIGGADGLEVIPSILRASETSKVLVLTNTNDTAFDKRAVRFGAMGLINKDDAPELLVKAIRKVNEGEAWLDRATIGVLIAEMSRESSRNRDNDRPTTSQLESLTKRERDVIRGITQGLKNKQIAEQLSISEITVRHHLTSIFDKLEVADRFELMIYAYKNGIGEIPK
jgi:two-component system nitrate/nitrite response regulator NarL